MEAIAVCTNRLLKNDTKSGRYRRLAERENAGHLAGVAQSHWKRGTTGGSSLVGRGVGDVCPGQGLIERLVHRHLPKDD